MNQDKYAADSDALTLRGWTWESVQIQREQLALGCQPAAAVSACELGHGIDALDLEERITARIALTRSMENGAKWVRFVPASGAASRMFAGIREPREAAIEAQLQSEAPRFPFWSVDQKQQLTDLPASERPAQAAVWMLHEERGWARLPKGLIPFHQTEEGGARNSFQEHVSEWRQLMGNAALHFTVPGPFQKEIQSTLEATNHGSITTSVQHPSTDTVAWDLEKQELVRQSHGGLLFRPGGHGALLQNLNRVAGDFICVRNIDNVVPASRMAARNEEQAILMGECARLTDERNAHMAAVRSGQSKAVQNAINWLSAFDEKAHEQATDAASCLLSLDRPLRVAGMVPNTGEPGGGPFWVKQANGRISPGIVESAELPDQMKGKGSHFNPVDLICSVQKPNGEGAYDLSYFADQNMFFTANKTWNGKSIRILERPGLWNGGMAHWLTRFVEMPNTTFAPVKTVLDLLKPERQI